MEKSLYDRVRAVYGIGDQDDDDDGGGRLHVDDDEHDVEMLFSRKPSPVHAQQLVMPSTVKPSVPSQPPAEFDWNPQAPAYQPPRQQAAKTRNMIHVPFDPDDQSEDEVITETAYRRQKSEVARAQGRQTKAAHQVHHRKVGPSSGYFAENQGRRTRRRGKSSRKSNKKGGRDANADPDSDDGGGSAASEAGPEDPIVPVPLVDMEPCYNPLSSVSMGQRCPDKTTEFCPWRIVTKYHKWFVGTKNSNRVEPYFQIDELLACQTWKFHYVWHPSPAKKDYTLVVPTEEFIFLLDRINRTLGISLEIPTGDLARRFRVTFGEHGTPRPRFLCHTPIPRKQFNQLRRAEMPPLDTEDMIYTLPNMTPQARAAYVKKFDSLLLSYDKKGQDKKKKSEKNRKRRLHSRRTWGKQAKRMQRHLGLRGTIGNGGSSPNAAPTVLDLNKPAPFAIDRNIVFVVMDIESFEFNHNNLTEIGFAILNGQDTVGVAPGPSGKNWFNLIRGRHLRIREHAHMVNRVHVKGCEDNFNFGKSEFVSKRDILQAVKNILLPKMPNGAPQQVVLIGHGIASDISLVGKIGFKIDRKETFLEIVDTQHLHQHYRMDANTRGLGWVLRDLDIAHSYLHNGGNDAVYTMQAFISLLIEKRQASLRRHHDQQKTGFMVDPTTHEEGWDTGGEESDGGDPSDSIPYESDRELTPRRFDTHSACSSNGQTDVTPSGKGNSPASKASHSTPAKSETESNNIMWF